MDDLALVLRKADGQLAMIGTLCEADLELQRVSPTLRSNVNAFLQNQRLALDHLAARVAAVSGLGDAHVHYPLAPDAPRFEISIDKNMPGVRQARPDVTAAVAKHQPYTDPALGRLRELLLDVKRQRLTPRSRPATPDEIAPPPAVPGTDPVPPVPPPPPAARGRPRRGPVDLLRPDRRAAQMCAGIRSGMSRKPPPIEAMSSNVTTPSAHLANGSIDGPALITSLNPTRSRDVPTLRPSLLADPTGRRGRLVSAAAASASPSAWIRFSRR